MLRPDLVCDYGNLLYACSICNSWKSDRSLPDPCVVPFSEHFRIKDDGSIEALSRQGMRMIKILRLDQLNEWRLRLLRILARIEQVEPAADTGLRTWFGYHDDLPELESLRPPDGNSRPDGIAQSHLSRLRRGELPTVY